MMKRLSLTILCCFLLSGCIFEPVFDTSNWSAYQRSSAAIRARLSNDDLRRLDVAMKYLLIESTPSAEINGLGNNTFAMENLANPFAILSRLGPRINGKSAAAIVQNLIIKLDAEIAETEARLQRDKNAVGAVEVISPSYYWKRSGYRAQPVIDFAVRNDGKVPISRIYFSGVLSSPHRSIPWARQEFVQTFKGGLEPRERQQITLQPPYGEWNDPQLKDLPDAELKVAVINYEDANGEKMIVVNSDGLEFRRKVRAMLQ